MTSESYAENSSAALRSTKRKSKDYAAASIVAKRQSDLEAGGLLFWSRRLEVRRGQSAVTLSPTEFLVLRRLAINAGETVSISDLAVAGWPEGAAHAVSVRVVILKLRKKMKPLSVGSLVEAVSGVGYRLLAF